LSYSAPLARFDSALNSLIVVRRGESFERQIRCLNLSSLRHKVFGIEINGDAIDLMVGPRFSRRPDRRIRYFFSSLSGGSTHPI
jgi:hypothetical protein